MTTQTLTINFHGTDLFIVEHDGQPYTPMKTIVEGMGLNWASQFVKLKSNEQRWGIVKIAIPTLGDMQEAICMPLRKLAGWLSTISPNKVKADLRDTIIYYQNECDDVLWNHWTKEHVQYGLKQLPEPKTKKALPGGLTLEMQDEIKALIKERVEMLPQEKWRGASMQLWGSIKKKFSLTKEQSYKDLSPEHYASCLSMLTRLELKGDPLLHVTPLELAALVDERVKAIEGELLPKTKPVQYNSITLNLVPITDGKMKRFMVTQHPEGGMDFWAVGDDKKIMTDEQMILHLQNNNYVVVERTPGGMTRMVAHYLPHQVLPVLLRAIGERIERTETGKLQA